MSQPKNETEVLSIHNLSMTVRGPSDMDVSGQASSGHSALTEGLQVSAFSKPLVSGAVGYCDRQMRTQHPVLDNALVCVNMPFGSGQGGSIPIGITKSLWQTGYSGSTNIITLKALGGQAFPSAADCMPGQACREPGVRQQRTGCEVEKPGYNQCYTPLRNQGNKPLHGDAPAQKHRKPEDHNNMLTATSSYVQGLIGQLSGLLGALGGIGGGNNNNTANSAPLSVRQTFSNLSNNEIGQIKANTTPEVYDMIVSAIDTCYGPGDVDNVTYLTDRVHPRTFANNMVALLCNCKSYVDVTQALVLLETDPVIQGKDKIPVQTFVTTGAYGEELLTIDGNNDLTVTLSPAAAAAQSNFLKFLNSKTYSEETVAAFYGQITNTSLIVSEVISGNVTANSSHYLTGFNVTANTQIISYSPISKAYTLNLPSNTPPNTFMELIKVDYTDIDFNVATDIINTVLAASNDSTAIANTTGASSGGGGAGGLGMLMGILGSNFFGEASKLLGEILPTVSPSSASAAIGNMARVAADPKHKAVHRPAALGTIAQRVAILRNVAQNGAQPSKFLATYIVTRGGP